MSFIPVRLIIIGGWAAFLPYLAFPDSRGFPVNRAGWQDQQAQVSVGEWLSFSPRGAPFAVTLPAMPKERTKDIELGVRMLSCELKTAANEYRIIWMTNLPKALVQTGSTKSLFQRALDEMLTSAREGGEGDFATTSEKDTTLNRRHGRESSMESGTAQIDAKGYVVDNQFVALAVRHSREEEASGEAKRFLDSLTLFDSEPIEGGKPGSGGSRPKWPPVPPPTEVDQHPVALNAPRPNYTDEAMQHRTQGVLRARILVDTHGSVEDVRLLSHLPYGLDEEGIAAIRAMRFKPAIKAGRRTDCWITIEVEFRP